MPFALASGAEARWSGSPDEWAVVCVDGGTAAEVPGTWSASVEWLVRRLRLHFPAHGFLEVRYRTKSWRRFDSCVEDGRAAVDAARSAGAERIALLGFSMGGAVAVRNAALDGVAGVIGVNPWLPQQLDLAPLAAKRLSIVHGAFDAPLPGVPGVKPSLSALAAERARAVGADVRRSVVPGFHAVALRRRSGGLVPVPGARSFGAFVLGELDELCA